MSFADRPKEPYLLIDSRRLDAGNMFIPVKENSELSLACVSEGGNPKPVLSWEILLSPGVDRHAQKISHELTHLDDVKKDTVSNGFFTEFARNYANYFVSLGLWIVCRLVSQVDVNPLQLSSSQWWVARILSVFIVGGWMDFCRQIDNDFHKSTDELLGEEPQWKCQVECWHKHFTRTIELSGGVFQCL